jgi:hypothetical protein
MNGQMVVVPVERIERAILSIRGEKVMLDSDLAELYGVETRVLNQAVKRNASRFPEDFVFQLNADEVVKLNRSQFVIGSQKHRDPRFPPYAFTEHGALMLANVLNSERAAQNDDTLMDLLESLQPDDIEGQLIWCYHEGGTLPQPFQGFSQRLLFQPAVHVPGVAGENKQVSVQPIFPSVYGSNTAR